MTFSSRRHSSTNQRSLVFIVLSIALFLISSQPAHADTPPRVFAFYYTWYDENTWNPNLVPDIPAEKYVSRDADAMAHQVDEAQGAGIDAFVASWLGPGNPTDENFKTLLEVAHSKNFKAAVDFEAEKYSSRDALINALSYVRDNLASHPAYARDANGKPILFFWREQNFSVDDWAQVRAAVDPDRNQIWIAEGVDVSYQRVFDGHHLYSIAWSPDVNQTLNDWSRRVRRAGVDKLWVATVMPGYDDTRTTRPDRFAKARNNGDFYRATWNAAINSHADWIIITSFNEWVEGTMIEPSVTYGNLYLDITREKATQFKAVPPLSSEEKLALAATSTPRPTQAATAVVAPPRTETPVPTPLDSGAYHTTAPLYVRTGPGTTYDSIAKLPPNFVLDVLAKSEDRKWLAIAYPDAGSLGWISAGFVAPQVAFDQLPVEPAPAKETPAPISTPSATPESSPAGSDDLPIWY